MSQSMKLGYPIENKYLIFTIAALISGFITSVCSLPMDLAKTRLQQQSCHYNGMISCLYGTARQEGNDFTIKLTSSLHKCGNKTQLFRYQEALVGIWCLLCSHGTKDTCDATDYGHSSL